MYRTIGHYIKMLGLQHAPGAVTIFFLGFLLFHIPLVGGGAASLYYIGREVAQNEARNPANKPLDKMQWRERILFELRGLYKLRTMEHPDYITPSIIATFLTVIFK